MTTLNSTPGTCPSKSAKGGRSGVKKLLKFFAAGTILTAALLPATISDAKAASYYPGYTCYYRDIAGSCLNYQTQNPYYFGGSVGTYRSPYGNRLTYPFSAMFNAHSTTKSPWDNRRSSNYYKTYRYEEDDDDNDYIDEDDDSYRYHYGDDDDEDWLADRSRGEGWRWYFDEDDDTFRAYRYQDDDDYDDGYGHGHRRKKNSYYEYEHTRHYCTGRHCSTTNYRY